VKAALTAWVSVSVRLEFTKKLILLLSHFASISESGSGTGLPDPSCCAKTGKDQVMRRLGIVTGAIALGAAVVWTGPALARDDSNSARKFANEGLQGRSVGFNRALRYRFNVNGFFVRGRFFPYYGPFGPCYGYGGYDYPYTACDPYE
jgi:hypothetical protein